MTYGHGVWLGGYGIFHLTGWIVAYFEVVLPIDKVVLRACVLGKAVGRGRCQRVLIRCLVVNLVPAVHKIRLVTPHLVYDLLLFLAGESLRPREVSGIRFLISRCEVRSPGKRQAALPQILSESLALLDLVRGFNLKIGVVDSAARLADSFAASSIDGVVLAGCWQVGLSVEWLYFPFRLHLRFVLVVRTLHVGFGRLVAKGEMGVPDFGDLLLAHLFG